MSELKQALEKARIRIEKFLPDKAQAVHTSSGRMRIDKFSKELLKRLAGDSVKYPKVVVAAHDDGLMKDLLTRYAEEEDLLEDSDSEETEIIIPQELEEYKLNINIAAKRGEDEFFLTTGDFVSKITGRYYINKCKIPLPVAYDMARPVQPEYRPLNPGGVFTEKNLKTNELQNIYNSYMPPEWMLWRDRNPKAWKKLPRNPPKLVMKLLKHLIPIKEERRYLYGWMYASLMNRSYVYLVLCGFPGSGKNRLKLLFRALHGADNAVDGKKSTLTERFNSQLAQGRIAWFDELSFNSEMENVMKEIQNDYFSIERKGVDATSSSKIYTSMVISNNKPRDNFIAFDARKFVPLVVAKKNLNTSMTSDEIDLLTKKIEPLGEHYDVEFVAQIAKWILRVGKRSYNDCPTLEYKGPMFWTLAHTSMPRWQKRAVTTLLDKRSGGVKVGWDEKENAHVWSKVEERIVKKDSNNNSSMPDYSSVKAFFDTFRDGNGKKAFKTKIIPGNNILGDFFIYPLISDLEIITDAKVAQDIEKGKEVKNGKKEKAYKNLI